MPRLVDVFMITLGLVLFSFVVYHCCNAEKINSKNLRELNERKALSMAKITHELFNSEDVAYRRLLKNDFKDLFTPTIYVDLFNIIETVGQIGTQYNEFINKIEDFKCYTVGSKHRACHADMIQVI